MELTKHWDGQLDDYVIDLAWSPDGAQLAAASASGPGHALLGSGRRQAPRAAGPRGGHKRACLAARAA